MDNTRNHHFIGIGGSGMMPLALWLAHRKFRVSGSDRAFDLDESDPRRAALIEAGIAIFPQKGSVPAGSILVASTAIEKDNPDLARAETTMHRSDLLVEMLRHESPETTILVGGSSGKSTTTAMIGWILDRLGMDPIVYLGAPVSGCAEWGVRVGGGPAVVEVDESDGSIDKFSGDVAVLTSVSEDHKSLAEIEAHFRRYLSRCRETVISPQAARGLGRNDAVIVVTKPLSGMLGGFNRINESLAVAAAGRIGIPEAAARGALEDFAGVSRRLEVVFHRDERRVIDDFAHNPEKLEASLAALKELGVPLMVIFQPHGYTPLRAHKAAWAGIFDRLLDGAGDRLVLLPVFDVGGNVTRDIGSGDLGGMLRVARTEVVESKNDARVRAVAFLEQGPSAVAVIGARDPGLSRFARSIAAPLAERRLTSQTAPA